MCVDGGFVLLLMHMKTTSRKKHTNFYDRIGKKYGGYDISGNNILREFPEGNPENIFRKTLLNYSGLDRNALDLGCGDGKFTLSIASRFKKIFAVDTSKILLAAALRLQKEKAIHNVTFEFQDAVHTNYSDNFFDVVYSRRGPVPFQEIQRVLKPRGVFIGIEIAELDCKELKEVLGKGQNYEEWNGFSRKQKNIKIFKSLDLKIISVKDYFLKEYYPDYKSLESFLRRAPIFEDFNTRKDGMKLIKYINNNMTSKGIELSRHKLVIVAKKL